MSWSAQVLYEGVLEGLHVGGRLANGNGIQSSEVDWVWDLSVVVRESTDVDALQLQLQSADTCSHRHSLAVNGA